MKLVVSLNDDWDEIVFISFRINQGNEWKRQNEIS